jgi:flagellar biosynthesis protein FlhB
MSLKTHEPSAGRLRRTERQGDLPVSTLATRSVAFTSGVLLLPAVLATLGLRCMDTLQYAITRTAEPSVLLQRLLRDVALVAVPWLAAIVLATTLFTLLQTRGFFNFGPLAPKLERLQPQRAWSNIVQGSHWLALLLALVAGLLVAGVGVYFVAHHLPSFAHATQRPLASAPLAARLVGHLAGLAVVLALLAGIADWLLRRGAWRQRQRMTRAEWLEDQKTMYGDPLLRAERKRLHREHLGA